MNIIIVGFLTCGLLEPIFTVDADVSEHNQNNPMNSDLLVNPEYVDALAKELEKEGLEQFKKQEEAEVHSSQGPHPVNSGSLYNKMLNLLSHSKLTPTDDENAAITDHVIFPTDLMLLKNPRKRNFDEIDRSGLKRKREFDEIDSNGFSTFRDSKRNFDEIDSNGFSTFRDSKRNFDEIDLGGLNAFEKRTSRLNVDGKNLLFKILTDVNEYNNDNRKRNFDEIDRSGISSFNRKRNFDEIDRNGFSKRLRIYEIGKGNIVPRYNKRSVKIANKSGRN